VVLAFAIVVGLANVAIFVAQREPSTRERTMEGVVVDESGRTIDGAIIAASKPTVDGTSLDVAAIARSSSGGHFQWAPPEDGLWFVTATAAVEGGVLVGIVEAAESGDRAVSIVMRSAAYVVRGTVRGEGPIPGASVRAVREGGSRGAIIATIADDHGEYLLGLPPRSYTIEASAPGFQSKKRPVSPSDVPVDFDLERGAKASGVVVSGKTGKPVPFAQVQANDVLGQRRSWAPALTFADREGRFSFDTLAPSEYRFQARGVQLLGYSEQSEIATISSPLQEIVIECWPGRVVAGRVRDREGRPIPHASLSVWREGAEGIDPETTTSADGSFTLSGVAPWKARLSINARGYVSQGRTSP